MFNGKGLDGIRGVLFDCYKTLIDIRTDESSIKTYEPISRWLMYHGVKIAPDELINLVYRRFLRERYKSLTGSGHESHAYK